MNSQTSWSLGEIHTRLQLCHGLLQLASLVSWSWACKLQTTHDFFQTWWQNSDLKQWKMSPKWTNLQLCHGLLQSTLLVSWAWVGKPQTPMTFPNLVTSVILNLVWNLKWKKYYIIGKRPIGSKYLTTGRNLKKKQKKLLQNRRPKWPEEDFQI